MSLLPFAIGALIGFPLGYWLTLPPTVPKPTLLQRVRAWVGWGSA